MPVLRSLMISFSIYSKIPVPQLKWEDRDMKYVLCFFPWVGAVIGVLTVLWGTICHSLGLGTVLYAAVGTAIPILISGGFHVDGFMDTMDAFHSYQSREKKLEILKDSHIGAFSVIQLAVYTLLYFGAYSEIDQPRALAVAGAGFFLSRTLSGIGVVTFPNAKNEGLLYLFSSKAHEKAVKVSLYLQLLLCLAAMLWLSLWTGIAVAAGALLTFFYWRHRCFRELGGITGDTCGYFVTVCEGVNAAAAAVCCIAGLV
ncbi:adenosylcobinamide-GDP ribazoletransferase [Caproiciproducens sp. CPB-2]|uniref:adenosylcobinamide-GDP ribazoletransferase n=1 Tax=Caproiciproducens sp. CPB-2 TaxID=3030017 RepID=UPI0023DC8EFD|nr:adenosylcobinamide-GDP ribazoletransferase [Caproiciproducens sp. CPB-2]MDF1495628.1 adenosylcobinamide-GDP ribazoletransferase [Caproiciproducens sp. CPB-2]